MNKVPTAAQALLDEVNQLILEKFEHLTPGERLAFCCSVAGTAIGNAMIEAAFLGEEDRAQQKTDATDVLDDINAAFDLLENDIEAALSDALAVSGLTGPFPLEPYVKLELLQVAVDTSADSPSGNN